MPSVAASADVPTAEATAPAGGDPRRADAFAAIASLSVAELSPADLLRRAFEHIAAHFAAPFASLSYRVGTEVVDEHWHDPATTPQHWADHAAALLLETQSSARAVARLYRDAAASSRVLAMAAPIGGAGAEPAGAVVVYARCDDPAAGRALLSELAALASLAGSAAAAAARVTPPSPMQDDTVHTAVLRAADYDSIHRLAFAITNNLRSRAGCDQVAFGVPRHHRVRILSISGMDDVKPRSPGTHHIRQAMEECADRGEPIILQKDERWADRPASSGHRLHRQWHDAVGGAAVASIPLMLAGRCVGVLSLRRDAARPFATEDLRAIARLVEPFAPAVGVVQRASRGLLAHGADAAADTARWLVKPVGLGRKLLLAAVLAVTGWVAFGTAPYAVTVQGVVTQGQARQVAAPFEGVIAEAPVRAGDVVHAGDVLVRFDTTEPELAAAELVAELAAQRVAIDQAVAADRLDEAVVLDAELAVLEARLAAARSRIARAAVLAPADGIVLRGDLSPRVGEAVPMGEPLLEFAPHGALRLELRLPEHLGDEVAAAMPGRFASHAQPETTQRFTLGRVAPAAEVAENASVFLAVAELPEAPDWIKPGMEGAARIEVGPRPVWWVLAHRAVDALRLRFWL